jgi:hypothetical protein
MTMTKEETILKKMKVRGQVFFFGLSVVYLRLQTKQQRFQKPDESMQLALRKPQSSKTAKVYKVYSYLHCLRV